MIVRFGGETLPILSHFDCTTAPLLTRSVYGRSQLFPRAPMFSMIENMEESGMVTWLSCVASHTVGGLYSPHLYTPLYTTPLLVLESS